jgi:hypothetical protein
MSKFPYNVGTTKTDAILSSLWFCVKFGVIVFIIVWAVMALVT